ncbi:hypothetical protein E8E12_004296 [Didymella heteroderae]|uniref:Uncharacterized protein n=1 Tax=Didymella heteroderae TaxID=1769908 RepID=A0A9P4WPU9_9PLEO|nr:hypothetical protein E8E12_004296 [Didymella heteroderae]
MSLTPNNPPTTKVQFLQNGTLHSISLPIACLPRDIESLQEYAQNSKFGTTNIMKSRGAYINNCLRSYGTEFEKIKGGVFDGLSKQETMCLREMGWKAEAQWSDEELSSWEMEYLFEASLPGGRPKFPLVSTRYAIPRSRRGILRLKDWPALEPSVHSAKCVLDCVCPITSKRPLHGYPTVEMVFYHEEFETDPYLEDVDAKLAISRAQSDLLLAKKSRTLRKKAR